MHAAAHTLGVVPAVYRRSGPSAEVLMGPVEVSVEITALGRRAAVMHFEWRAEIRSGHASVIWCWRDAAARTVIIPEAARVGILAIDGARIQGARA